MKRAAFVATALLATSVVGSLGSRASAHPVVPRTAQPSVVVPEITVGSATVIEGDVGTAVVNVPVDLSAPANLPVTVHFAITGDTATPKLDFQARAGTMTFKAGIVSKQLSVRVYGDTNIEPDEHVAITLSNPVNATIANGDGGVTITDDDSDATTKLQVNISDVTVTEADGGKHTASLAVTLSQPSTSIVKVHYAFAGGICGQHDDGTNIIGHPSGTLTFPKNVQTRQLTFTVVADLTAEQARTFVDSVTVSSGPAVVNESQGDTTVIDNDGSLSQPPQTSTLPIAGDASHLAVGDLARMSVASDGTEAHYGATFGPCTSETGHGARDGVVSANGRYVAFVSDADNLVPGDDNGLDDVFVHDRQTGHTERVNVWNDGSETPAGNNAWNALDPSITPDGRYVSFWSNYPLVAGGGRGIYVHDRQTGTTEYISVGLDGRPDDSPDTGPAVMSADGRYVAFSSEGDNLVTNDTDPTPNSNNPDATSSSDIFVRDRVTGTTTLVSVGSGTLSGNSIFAPSISADGRYVAFDSTSPNIVPGDTDGCSDVFVRDMITHTTERVSLTTSGQQQALLTYPSLQPYQRCGVGAPVISGDGSTVAFMSAAWNFYGLSSSPYLYMSNHLYVHDVAAHTTTLVDTFDPATLAGSLAPRGASMSTDGSTLFWSCLCDDGQQDTVADLYVYDVATGGNRHVGNAPDGTIPDDWVWLGGVNTLSPDGAYIVFDTVADNLAPEGDTNEVSDVFIQRVS